MRSEMFEEVMIVGELMDSGHNCDCGETKDGWCEKCHSYAEDWAQFRDIESMRIDSALKPCIVWSDEQGEHTDG